MLPDLEHRACPADARHFAEQFSGERYSLVFAFRLPSATWIESLGPFASSLPKIVDFDDVESLAYARRLNWCRAQRASGDGVNVHFAIGWRASNAEC